MSVSATGLRASCASRLRLQDNHCYAQVEDQTNWAAKAHQPHECGEVLLRLFILEVLVVAAG